MFNTYVIHGRDAMLDMSTLAERLIEARTEAGLTQAELAKKAGVSQGSVGNIEAGTRQRPRDIVALAMVLDVRPEWLRYERGPKREVVVGEPVGIGVARPRRSASTDRFAVDLPHLDVTASMGQGKLPQDHYEIIKNISVDLEALRREGITFTAPKNLNFITGLGDSMAPTFSHGDPLLIDTGVSAVTIDAVYVFELGEHRELFIKTLQRIPGRRSLKMISDNRKYDPHLIEDPEKEQLVVRGRVLIAWNMRRLG